MLIRMIVIQSIQSRIIARKGMSNIKKYLVLFIIFIGLLSYDVNKYFSSKFAVPHSDRSP